MMQRGRIWRKGKSWYAQWRQDEIIKDSEGNHHVVRRQHAERICAYSDRYRSKKDVQPLVDDKLRPLNEGRAVPESTLTVADYYSQHFLPFITRELRPATVHGYKWLWKLYLKARLEKIVLRDFRCVDASNLLADIHRVHKIGRKSLRHCKGLLGSIFTHAKRSGVLDGANPIRDAAIPRAAEKGRPTYAYGAQEIMTMLDVLTGVAQTAVGVMFFCGLRPAEARGLKWEDYDCKSRTLRISRSMWRKFTTDPKTEASIASVPVPQVLADILDKASHTSEYMLASPSGYVVDLHNLASRVIRPELAKCGTCRKEKHTATSHEYSPTVEWHGLYAFRRGCATLAASLDSSLAAKSLLRHSNIATTEAFYIKSIPGDATRVMQKMDALFEKPTANAVPN
jgi:integrase